MIDSAVIIINLNDSWNYWIVGCAINLLDFALLHNCCIEITGN